MSHRLRALSRLAFTLALLAAILLALRQLGLLQPDTGRFTAIDGDSLRRGDIEVRLHGIDAPELHQDCVAGDGRSYPCGREARSALARLVAGQDLTCTVTETDRYGRDVATCRAGDVDINAAMVRSGWAVAYRRHGTAYLAEERAAKAAGRGLWQGPFEEPEAWRNRNRDSLSRGSMTGDRASIQD